VGTACGYGTRIGQNGCAKTPLDLCRADSVPRYQRRRRLGTELGTLAGFIVADIPGVANQEGGRPLGGIAVVSTENVRVGLQEKPNVSVPDPHADRLRAYLAFKRTGGARVAQIWKVIRESPAAAARRSNRCLIVSGCGGRPSSKVKT
jgi:hypothetical protein